MKRILNRAKQVAQLDRGALKRVLGVTDLFAIGFGDLGSSIYYALGITALYAMGATPIALVLAGVVFVCTALTYAELASTFHESGGTASFARHAFNDLISFIAGWGLLFDYIVTIAISAFAIAPYLSFFFPVMKEVQLVHLAFTVGIILLLLLINTLGVHQSTRMSFVLVSVTIVTQLIIVVIAIFWLFDLEKIIDHLRINVPNVSWSPTWPEFWKGTAMAMVAYTGIESIAQLGAEAKKPSKTVPRAIMITMAVLVLMYIGISLSALSVVSPLELGTTYVDDPVAGIVNHLPFGNVALGAWVGIFAAVLLFVASNAGLVGASRLSFNMGEYYQLPRFFYKLHKRFRTPYVALAFFAVVAIIIVLVSEGRMVFLADLYNFGAMIAFFFAHLSVIMLRIKKPNLHRPFRIPFNIRIGKHSIPLTAVIGCLATFSVWVLVVVTKPAGRYIGFAWMIFGVCMYLYYRKKYKLTSTGQLEIERVHVPDYKPLEVKNILVPILGRTQVETLQMACELAHLHEAKISAIHVIEVPASMPLDATLESRTLIAEAVLKRAEAIAREFNLTIELRVIRARYTDKAILEILNEEKVDLLVIGAAREKDEQGVGLMVEKILRNAPCRVWVCSGEKKSDGLFGEDRLLVTY
ncbi:MAG: universal stress protein [Chlamydiales bacterium]|nr:universal stress protein [Chlamydiales bacterium]